MRCVQHTRPTQSASVIRLTVDPEIFPGNAGYEVGIQPRWDAVRVQKKSGQY